MPSFAQRVADWQVSHGRHDLPWQGTRDPYRIWLSEIMLQQTQVSTVIPYFARFVAAFPSVGALAAAPLDRVLEHWSGLGYYRRAHHLHAAARRVVADHGSAFPRGVEALAALPGVGESTAAAIAVFAWGERAAILDGNVKRVLARHAGIAGYPGTTATANALWREARLRLPASGIESYTQGLMDLGASVCLRANPRCDDCPVAADCVARREGRVAELPSPRPAKTLPRRELRLLLIESAGELLLEKRPAAGIWAGLWSLPEVGMDADVSAHCRAFLGVEVTRGDDLPVIEHAFTHYRLTLHPVRVRAVRPASGVENPGRLWLAPADAVNAALPAPIRALLRSLAGSREPANARHRQAL